MIASIESRLNEFATYPDGWDLDGVHFSTGVILSARRLSRRASRFGFRHQVVLPDHDGSLLLTIHPTRDSEFEIAIEPDGTFALVINDCHEMGLPEVDESGFTYEQVVERMRWMSLAVRHQTGHDTIIIHQHVEAVV